MTVYELRTYHAAPGRMDALLARFREHTVAIFARHGMTSIGYWVPATEPGAGGPDRLVYLLAHADRAAATASWAAFQADPQWQRVRAASEADGPVVDRIDSELLEPVDFSMLR
ncbi:MAG TPA: NIPSNAP family protein [Cellulomonas sp.]